MAKWSDFKKYLLIFLAVLALFSVSEVIYNFYNNTPQLISFYLRLSNICLQKKNYSCESTFLRYASDTRYRFYKNSYSDLIKVNRDFWVDPLLLQKYSLGALDYNDYQLVKTYYNLGLRAYAKGDTKDTRFFWQKAVYLNPDLSYTYIELANLYQKDGDSKSAKSVLTDCMLFSAPRTHCRVFLETEINNGIFETPGFLESAINGLYRSD